MNRCTAPALAGDTRYVFGEHCTWHGPIALAASSFQRVDVSSHGDEPRFDELEVPCCPHCGDRLFELATEDEMWATVLHKDAALPGTEAMWKWSQGKCFPDFDTLQNAYRQAMEGQS